MKMFLLGSYATGAAFTFVIVGFCVVLSGRSKEVWRPFVYAAAWPVMLPLFITGRLG